METNPNTLIYRKIIAVMRDIKVIAKTQTSETKEAFSFRGIDDIYNALHPLFQEHGIFCTTEILSQIFPEKRGTVIEAKFTFHAEDGSSVYCITRGESKDKKGDDGTSKANTKAQKSALIQMFLIPTSDATAPPKEKAAVTPKAAEKDNRPWLTGSTLKKALERIEGGEEGLYEKINKAYQIRNAWRHTLKQATEKAKAKAIVMPVPEDFGKLTSRTRK